MTEITPVVIDLFHGDDVTSWDDLKGAGILGVIHKASEGTDVADAMYARRRPEAAARGLLWGAYHFMRPGDPVAQAAWFLHHAAPDAATLIACDHEDAAVPLVDAVAFMQAVEKAVGRQAVLYSGSLIKEQLADADPGIVRWLAGRRGWLPEYGPRAVCPACWGPQPWLWQYTGDGVGPQPHTVAGVSGAVDLNHFYGDAETLAAEWAGDPS